MAEPPMLLLAFVAGAVFGGALCLSLVITLVSEVVSNVGLPPDSEWKYE